MNNSLEPIVELRAHHVSNLYGIGIYSIDEMLEPFEESGYENPEAFRPALEKLKKVRQNPDQQVRFHAGVRDFFCEYCSVPSRCPDVNDKDNKELDKIYLERYGLVEGDVYKVSEIINKVDEEILKKRFRRILKRRLREKLK